MNTTTEHRPHVPASESPAEFTIKAIGLGILFGIIFGAANAYLGLRAGLTVSTSIPIAVMTVAMFRVLARFGRSGTLLEANIAQTTGSASSSLASGVIFTLPALFMWGMPPSLLQMTVLALCGGLLGVLFMIPLRQLLIEREHARLPYPEGTAAAKVLIASEVGGRLARLIAMGLAVGALGKLLTGWLRVVPDMVTLKLPLLRKAEVGMDVSAALFGVGWILGLRIAAVMVSGGLLAWVVIIPMIDLWGQSRVDPVYPELVKTISSMSAGEIWSRYIRYIGAGAVAAAGILTLIRTLPMMFASFRSSAGELGRRVGGEPAAPVVVLPRTQQDLPLKVILIGLVAVIAVLALVPAAFGSIGGVGTRTVAALCVAMFAFFFTTVAARIVGMVGVTSNPTSGMTIASLLGTAFLFLLLGWTDLNGKAGALMVGCVVAIAASISGDMSQDLKTGYLLGATPRRQQTAQLIAVLTSAVFVCLSVLLLAGTFGFGTADLPAPQATLMKLVIDGVIDQALPWHLVGIGVAIAIAAELLRVPSLPFAVGIYLPVAAITPIFLGGLLHWLLTRRRDAPTAQARGERGVLIASGLVGGEGLLGVALAGAAFFAGQRPAGIGTAWLGGDLPTQLFGAAVFAVLVIWFLRQVRR